MDGIKINVSGGEITSDEIKKYIERGRQKNPNQKLLSVDIVIDGEYVDLSYEYEPLPFEHMIRVFEGYIGSLEPVNDGKRAEVNDRVTHYLEKKKA